MKQEPQLVWRVQCSLVFFTLILCAMEGYGQDRPTSEFIADSRPSIDGKIFRRNDNRVPHDDARAAALGIQRYESKHLLLYTDIDPEIARTLPGIIDEIYPQWENYFGALPPARDGSEYQITAYLMQDGNRFVAAGMQPTGFMMARFGRQIGLEIWMNEQPSAYYRRHLLIHECTHAFMTTLPNVLPPLWYLEGMAEYFSTHTVRENGMTAFEVMPALSTDFPNLGRIETIREQLHLGKEVSLSQIGQFTAADFIRPKPIPYAWCWAVCTFLERHPRYHDRFRKVAQNLEYSAFQLQMAELFEADSHLLKAEWNDFIHRLDYGDDIASNSFVLHSPVEWPENNTVEMEVSSRQGWQSTGLRVQAGIKVEIAASGRVTLNPVSPRLESEPQGITVEYSAGFPIGTLLAGWLPVDSSSTAPEASHLQVTAVGVESVLICPADAELWLRVNDLGSDITNNSGGYQVLIKKR